MKNLGPNAGSKMGGRYFLPESGHLNFIPNKGEKQKFNHPLARLRYLFV